MCYKSTTRESTKLLDLQLEGAKHRMISLIQSSFVMFVFFVFLIQYLLTFKMKKKSKNTIYTDKIYL